MTPLTSELAHKQPAEIVGYQPERTVINGHAVRKDTGGLILGLALTVILAILLAGYLLSTL